MLSAFIHLLSDHWASTTALILLAAVLLKSYRKTSPLPPGPIPVPFLGTISLLRGGDKRRVFQEMRERYGDVFSFYIGSRLIVVINGFAALKEAFVKRGDVFSDRPHMFTVDKVGQGRGIVNTSGKVWKEQRRFTLAALRQFGFGKASFQDKVQEEVEAFITVLDHHAGEDVDPQGIIQTAIANVISSIVFGERFSYDDPLFEKFLEIFDENMKLVGGTSILNFFPIFQYLPGDIFKFNKVLSNVAFVQTFIRDTVQRHIENLDTLNIRDFIDAYLKEMQEEADDPETTLNYEQLVKVIGDLFVGGTETTSTTIRWAIIFLVRNPEVQQRMRDEIDRHVERARQPSVSDKPNLPYTEATILEIQRCADIAPFSVAHGTLQDVTFRNYLVPRNSIVIPNIHSVLADPELWVHPSDFRPERFLDDTGSVTKPEHFIPFFMGRRVCLGESLARMELFLFISALVQRYDIRAASNGQLPSLEGQVGLTYTPPNYTVRMVRRS
ncbi:cytochrome P450 18a1-like [Haliotis rubra]|uniref:cytochrome P450 18a1-like n=1 Tax=Haliotis rubra TaxID=36100 RepID=UPI001EE5812B|nr:cytochrome P450 18a1-like [Haliotis rubra]